MIDCPVGQFQLPDGQLIRIKLEVDTNPPGKFNTEVRPRLNPLPFTVTLFTPDSLFAGKIHALLYRNWKTRVKGRDYFDFQWYLKNRIPVNLTHLRERMVQTGKWDASDTLTLPALKSLLDQHFSGIDFKQAAQEVIPFLTDPRETELWSAEWFSSITREYLTSV